MRLPLYAKILLWFFINLLALAAAGWWFSGGQFPPGLDSLLAGRAGDRVQAAVNVISDEVHDSPEEQWNDILKRFEAAYHVHFYLFNNRDGAQLAGDPVQLPPAVHAKLVERPVPPPGGMQPPPPPGVDDLNPPPPPPSGPGVGPPQPGDPGGRAGGPNPPPGGRTRFMIHTADPSRYWVLVRIPPMHPGPGPRLAPASVITEADTLSGGGLFFNPVPWLAMGGGAIVFSALLWLPLVRGITRSIRRLTGATEQIAEGRFDVRVSDARRDELGSLGGAINRMAARLSGFVGGQKRFLGDIAHELCSPLARAQVALSILEQRGDGQKEFVTDVREEIELMSNLVNELLSFSKASIGAPIKLQAVALRPIVEKAAAREARGTQAEISVTEHLRVMAEPELLLRSISNLVRNAMHYAGDAGPVTISAAEQDGKIALTVADCGPGVPADALAQVFDPFYRVDPSRARETGGVGLGLAIVKTCVESCGGTVTARNREPSGLEVVLTLQNAGAHATSSTSG